MKTETKPQREGGHISSSSRSRRLATTILALTILGPTFAFAQIPPRFYWKSLAGANAVPVIYQSLSGNANPLDPADLVVSDNANIDAMCMWLLKNPHNYDVLVAPNLYGDIVSDLCAQMVGGLGFGCSGNIGTKLGVFEPTHGSAPKHAGKSKANPIATILAAKMMLDWLGEKEMAEKLENAVAQVIKEGKVRTYDMGGSASTMDMANAVAGKLN